MDSILDVMTKSRGVNMSVWVLGYVLILVIIMSIIINDIKNNVKSQKNAFFLAFSSFGAGFALYTIGYFQSGYSLILSFVRGFYSTIRMFFMNDDFGQIQNSFQANGILSIEFMQVIFATLHVIIAYVVAYTIYQLVLAASHKFFNTIRLILSIKKKLYIIIGDDIKSEHLANHISDKDANVVFFTYDTYDRYSNNIDSSIITYKISDLFENGQLKDALFKKMGVARTHFRPEVEVVVLTGDEYFNISFGHELIKHIFEDKKYTIKMSLHLFLNQELLSDYTMKHLNKILIDLKDKKLNNAPLLDINLINKRNLAVSHLFKDYPLYNNLSIDETTASVLQKEINILIVGFDSIGKTLLYRLLETENYVTAEGNLIPINIYVFDERWDSMSNLFDDIHPTFKKHFPNVTFYSNDIMSHVFHNFIEHKDIEWQYIAIGYEREEINLQTALQLHRILKNQSPERSFCIATYIENLNHTYKNFEHIIIENQVKLFGNIESVFNPDIIFNQISDKLAKMINFDYVKKGSENYAPVQGNVLWAELDIHTRDSNKSAANHLHNKLRLLGNYNLDNLSNTPLTISNIQLMNLAIVEHARWNAFHKLRDWTTCNYEELMELRSKNLIGVDTHKSNLLKKHYSLVEWHELDDISVKLKVKEVMIPFMDIKNFYYSTSHFKSLDIKQILTLIAFVNREWKHIINTKVVHTTEEKKPVQTYTPSVVDTSKITLDASILDLSEQLAKNTHENWSQSRMNDGWKYGPKRDDQKKEHPSLIPYEDLSESEKHYDRTTSLETLKLIVKLGYKIVRKQQHR